MRLDKNSIIITITSLKLQPYDAQHFIRIIAWDVLNNNISEVTKELARRATNYPHVPDLVKAIAEWNLDYPPDEVLFTLIDELIEAPKTVNANGNSNI